MRKARNPDVEIRNKLESQDPKGEHREAEGRGGVKELRSKAVEGASEHGKPSPWPGPRLYMGSVL